LIFPFRRSDAKHIWDMTSVVSKLLTTDVTICWRFTLARLSATPFCRS